MTELQNSLYWLRLIQLIIAIPLLSLVGQGLVYVLTRGFGQEPKTNIFYRLLQTIASPFVRVARFITPRIFPDSRVPFVAFCLLLVGYIWTMFAIANLCATHGLTLARCLQK